MSKKLINIFSNISSSLIIRDEKRKEELKNFELEENERIYGYRWPNDYMKSHKQDYLDGKMRGYAYDKSSYGGSYYNSSTSSDYCVIYFYEWSSLDGNQHKFYSCENFFSFCKKNDIELNEFDRSSLRNMSTAYITCTPNSNKLLIRNSYYTLQTSLDYYKRNPVNV